MKINHSNPLPTYLAEPNRYDYMKYRGCGYSGILLPQISLGLWHNFGHKDNFTRAREIARTAFDHGVTHFDLANNYGPSYGAVEENLGGILIKELKPLRDELFVSSRARYDILGMTFTLRIKSPKEIQLYRSVTAYISDFPLVRERLSKEVKEDSILDNW